MSRTDRLHTTETNHMTTSTRKAPQTMGASRDYTAANDQRWGQTATLVEDRGVSTRSESPRRRGGRARSLRFERGMTTAPQRTERLSAEDGGAKTALLSSRTSPAPRVRKGRPQRVGSQQVLTHRGRRIGTVQRVSPFAKTSFYALALLLGGVFIAMGLSGLSTAQTFKIQQLSVQENTLDNQLETLNRDLEDVRSSADVARRAAEDSMGVPAQAGIVEVQENGDIAERRPAEPETDSIIDVNGAPVRPGQASSDPNETEDVNGNLNAVPQGTQSVQAPQGQQAYQAPYAARRTN